MGIRLIMLYICIQIAAYLSWWLNIKNYISSLLTKLILYKRHHFILNRKRSTICSWILYHISYRFWDRNANSQFVTRKLCKLPEVLFLIMKRMLVLLYLDTTFRAISNSVIPVIRSEMELRKHPVNRYVKKQISLMIWLSTQNCSAKQIKHTASFYCTNR